MHKQRYKHAYINSQNSSPPFVNSSTKGRRQTINKDVYAIYIHEEEGRKVSSPCIHALQGEGMPRP